MLKVRRDVERVADVLINGCDNQLFLYDAMDTMEPTHKMEVFLHGVDALDLILLDTLEAIKLNQTALEEVRVEMLKLTDVFTVLMGKLVRAKADSSAFMEDKLREFINGQNWKCAGVCAVGMLAGALVVPICATCIAINHAGLIPAEEERVRATLDKTLHTFDGFSQAFATYKKQAIEITKETRVQTDQLSRWQTDVQIMRQNLAADTLLFKQDPTIINRLRTRLQDLKANSQTLKNRFLATGSDDVPKL